MSTLYRYFSVITQNTIQLVKVNPEREITMEPAVQINNQTKSDDKLARLREPFHIDEVEFRLSQCGEKNGGGVWAQCLAYISARAIQDRLDEVCGPNGWKVAYEFVGTKGVICNLSILCGNEWVTKQDGAEMTDIESFKGGISSALKRAGSAWGMGRYLYGLDSFFATIVQDRNTKNAQYGKTKNGTVFYWTPPELPAWALPKNQMLQGMQEIPKTGPAPVAPSPTPQPKGPVIAPRQEPKASVSEVGAIPHRNPSQAQIGRLWKIASVGNISNERVHEFVLAEMGLSSVKDLSIPQYNQLCDLILTNKFPQAPSSPQQETPPPGEDPGFPDESQFPPTETEGNFDDGLPQNVSWAKYRDPNLAVK